MKDIGLQRGTVQLIPYKESWAVEYSAERAMLIAALGVRILDIQHIGSTSVPVMVAKPIIDIAIAVSSLAEVDQLIAPLQTLGYEFKGEAGVPNRRFFVKGPESHRTHYLHISKIDTEFRRLVLFRNLLIADGKLAEEYASLKRDLALKFASDRASYTKGKNKFIENVLS